ncbi:MAG: N-acetylglucosamine-6-phosphate deacetylase [Planctomycetota bacterium]
MSRLRGRLLVDGKLITGTVAWNGGHIVAVELEGEIGGADLPIVAPGFIDLHVHGFGGFDPLDADGGLEGMARALAAAGTTAFQPTLFPAAPEALGQHAENVWTNAVRLGARGARVVGIHLEGPFVNPKTAGALPIADLALPSLAALRAILGPATGDGRGVRTMTLAPELPGAADLVRELARSHVRVSLGHSAATAAEARAAARDGACGATHLFNAMAPLHHREAGLAGFALTDAALACELIGDLVHVGAEAIELALRARGPQSLCLVSDALRGAGTGCDVFHAHGREHLVRAGTAYYPAREAGGAPKLAGSAMSQLDMVRRLTTRGVIGVPEALTMATAAPAHALGIEDDAGVLRTGARADFVVLRGPRLDLEEVWIGGVSQLTERAGTH